MRDAGQALLRAAAAGDLSAAHDAVARAEELRVEDVQDERGRRVLHLAAAVEGKVGWDGIAIGDLLLQMSVRARRKLRVRERGGWIDGFELESHDPQRQPFLWMSLVWHSRQD